MWKLALLLVAVGQLPAQMRSVPSLKDLPPLMLEVDIEAPLAVGIGSGELREFISRKLTVAGVRQHQTFVLWAPKLWLRVTAPEGDQALYGIFFHLSQFVWLYRPLAENFRPNAVLQTWEGPNRVGMLRSNGIPVTPVRETVDKLLDEFIKDYKEANLTQPKTSPTP